MNYFETKDTKNRDKELEIIADKLNISCEDLWFNFFEFAITLNSIKSGHDVVIYSNFENAGVIYNLVLKNCSTENTQIFVDWFELSQLTEYEYRLEITNGEGKVVCFDFTDAIIEKQAINAFSDCPVFLNTRVNYAQYYLSCCANNIVCHNEEKLSTDNEKSVLPLAKFMGDYSDEIPHAFWDLAEKHNITDLVNRYKDNKDKLFIKLFTPRYKDFLIDIYNILYDSQREIPSLIQLFDKEDIFTKFRDNVTDNFKKAGFTGEYPCYYNDRGFVYCLEDSCFDGPQIKHICSCACFQAKKLQKIPTFFEALLMANEFKKNLEEYKYNIVSQNFVYDEEVPTEKIIEISAKYINNDKLTKEEKKYCADEFREKFSPVFAILCFIFCGVLFGLPMTIGFMLIELVICMIVTGFNFSIFTEAFMATPWWLVGITSGGLFALCMTVWIKIYPLISRLFRRRK